MPIPMGRSGNVDGEGGTPDGAVRGEPMGGSWRPIGVHKDYRMRKRLVSYSLQPGGSIRWTWTTRIGKLAEQSPRLLAASVELARVLAELTNDADGDGTHGS